MTRPLRIGFLSELDGRVRSSWSGTLFYMARALERHGEVVHLDAGTPSLHHLGRLRSGLSLALTGRKRPYQHTRPLARAWARRVERLLRGRDLDVLFAPAASTQIALLDTDLPIVYTSDATIELLADYYPRLSDVDPGYMREAVEVERRALERADVLLYPTSWAARSAVEQYGIAEERVRLAPYGANMDTDVLPGADPGALLAAKPEGRCAVTFIGVEWERKGGDVAVEAVRRLREMGVDAELTVCGCRPPAGTVEPWLRVISRLDKEDPADHRALSRLLLESTFLLLPTRQECYGIVFCEASAHGTPSLAPDTGGVGGVLVDAENGFLLPEGSPPGRYAEVMAEALGDRDRYAELVASSRRRYDETLSWERWGEVAGRALGDAARE